MVLTNWSNITTAQQILAIANTNTSGWAWTAILFMFWIILALVFSLYNVEIAILSATFSALIASILLTYMGLVAWGWVLFFTGALIFTILYIIWSSNKN